MRTIGLIILVMFFPVFIHAAELININTADVATLNTLPYIKHADSSIAMAIVDYRTKNGPFATIEDIMKVTGIKEGIFAHIQSLITVGDTSMSNVSNASPDETANSTSLNSSEDTTTYTPSALTVDAGPNQDAVVEAPLHFSARAATRGGTVDPSAQIVWGFGDGSSATAGAVLKTYYYAGTYLVVVTATDGLATGRDEIVVTVRPAQARILEIPGDGIMIANDANERLDISNWILSADTRSFHIPNGTVILPKASVLLPPTITNLLTASDVSLAYPDGVIAAKYAPPLPVASVIAAPVSGGQPSASQTSSNIMQTVEPIISTKTDVQKNEETVSAPAAPADYSGAAGAALPSPETQTTAPTSASATVSTLIKSPWTLGFLGVVILTGGAFILL